MIVSTFWADEILLVPTWIITISILLIFIFPLESDKIAVAEKMRNHILNSL
jgi:hypothetical protein